MKDIVGFDQLRNLAIGVLEFVSPSELKVLVDIDAPQNTAITDGVPTLFPKVNGFVLVPNETGAIVGFISWIGVENSQYPKRRGLKDFDLIDLPYPQRKMSISPLGVLKNSPKNGYEFERGVYSYPSVGDTVVLPTQDQLRAIVENKDKNAKVVIGYAPIAANAPVTVNPDRLFGRHLAVLGNTGSGKSCSVAGLIRWSLEQAKKDKASTTENINARFIVLDPNGEYSSAFQNLGEVRKFSVKIDEVITGDKQLRVPAWMWNSFEWGSITQASGKTQRPLLMRALRELRGNSASSNDDRKIGLRSYFSSCLVELNNDLKKGVVAFKGNEKNHFGKKLMSMNNDARNESGKSEDEHKSNLLSLADALKGIADKKFKTFKKGTETVEYYEDFDKAEVEAAIGAIRTFLETVGGFQVYKGPNEDSPVFFNDGDLPNHLERLGQEQNVIQFIDFLIMRIRTMLSDSRMRAIIGTKEKVSLDEWLNDYVGKDNAENGQIAIIDLSLVPSDITHLVIAVISRLVFEAHQRYRRLNGKELPSVIVLEEAHTFIKRYDSGNDDVSPSKMCCQTFEKIAREGRKFGLGLLLSSQRPSELSPTVLSQCNTFLLHRIVNDKDQELVGRLVPDNLGSLLKELPVLPTKKAILLGWASPIPILVEMRELGDVDRPQSSDPKFWNTWTGVEKREIDWKKIADKWIDEAG